MNHTFSPHIAHAACASVSLPSGERAVITIGGLLHESGYRQSVLKYTLSSDDWIEYLTLPMSRAYGNALAHDGKLLYFGGLLDSGSFNFQTFELNLDTFAWTER